MGRLDKYLKPGEEILYQTDVHWIELLKPAIALVLCANLIGFAPEGMFCLGMLALLGCLDGWATTSLPPTQQSSS